MRDRVRTNVIRNADSTSRRNHTPTDTSTWFNDESLQRRSAQANPLRNLQAIIRQQSSIHRDRNASSSLQRRQRGADGLRTPALQNLIIEPGSGVGGRVVSTRRAVGVSDYIR